MRNREFSSWKNQAGKTPLESRLTGAATSCRPRFFDCLERNQARAANEIQLTDALRIPLARAGLVGLHL